MKTIIILLLSVKAAYLFELNSTNHINKGFMANAAIYNPKEFPYVVTLYIHIVPEKTKYLTCTGSLVREYFVLTAAHCIYKTITNLIEVSILICNIYIVIN